LCKIFSWSFLHLEKEPREESYTYLKQNALEGYFCCKKEKQEVKDRRFLGEQNMRRTSF